MAFQLASTLDRELVPLGQPVRRLLKLEVIPPPARGERPPVSLALVIDCSGSMHGDKLEHAKTAACQVVRQLGPRDRVAVIAYDDNAHVIASSKRLTPERQAVVIDRVKRLHTRGSTNLFEGWLTGCQAIAEHLGDGPAICRTILLSDGLANRGITSSHELTHHAGELRLRGVSTSTMGIGADFDELLLEQMAKQGGGRFQYIAHAGLIDACVAGELGETLQVAGRDATIELTLPDGVDVAGCLNEVVIERGAGRVRLVLGDLIADQPRSVLIELTVETTDYELLLAAALVVTPAGEDTPIRLCFPEMIMKVVPPEAAALEMPNLAVVAEAARLTVARAQYEAALLGRNGDWQGAALVLRAAATSISDSPAAGELGEEIGRLERDARETELGMSEPVRKDLHYRSNLLRESRQRYDGGRY
ncbi:MAG: VWA domain-containing protein [Dehalococcoidia bacterium]